MSHDDKFSDEQIQAFVDDEIDTHDRAEIMEAVRNDEELACRVCELLQLKDSVSLAYREPPQPDHDGCSCGAIYTGFGDRLAVAHTTGFHFHCVKNRTDGPCRKGTQKSYPACQHS